MSTAAPTRLLLARIGEMRLALPIDDVEEILDSPSISPVAPIHPRLIGLLRYRDGWIPVVDAVVAMDGAAPATPLPARRWDQGYAIVLGAGGRAAFPVDALEGIVAMDGMVPGAGEAPVRLLDPQLLLREERRPAAPAVASARDPEEPGDPLIAFRIGPYALAVRVPVAAEVVDIRALRRRRQDGCLGSVHTARGTLRVIQSPPGLEPAAPRGGEVLVLTADGLAFGIVVDEVEGVLEEGITRPLPELLAGAVRRYVAGTHVSQAGIHILIEPAALLDERQREAVARAAARARGRSRAR